eukprot:254722-Pelagomonas_calceolata.AAC.1
MVKPLWHFGSSRNFSLCERKYVWAMMSYKVTYILLTFKEAANIHGNYFEVVMLSVMGSCGDARWSIVLLGERSCVNHMNGATVLVYSGPGERGICGSARWRSDGAARWPQKEPDWM